MAEHHETAKHVVDALSLVTVIGTLVEMLPAIAALFTIVWTATVQKLLGKEKVNEEDEGKAG